MTVALISLNCHLATAHHSGARFPQPLVTAAVILSPHIPVAFPSAASWLSSCHRTSTSSSIVIFLSFPCPSFPIAYSFFFTFLSCSISYLSSCHYSHVIPMSIISYLVFLFLAFSFPSVTYYLTFSIVDLLCHVIPYSSLPISCPLFTSSVTFLCTTLTPGHLVSCAVCLKMSAFRKVL